MSGSFSGALDSAGRRFDQLVETNVIYHAIFWLFLYFFMIIINQSSGPLGHNMLFNLFNVGCYAGIVYFNLLYLFPKYLNKNKILIYVLLVLLAVLVITPLKGLLLFSTDPSGSTVQEFITNPQLFLTTFFIACSSSIFKIINDWFVHKNDRLDLQRQSLQSELKFLKSQINPHFLFNTLNSLYALTLKKSDQAPEIVLRLSEMMRYMLYECNERLVPLEKEINYIENYIELERIRHGTAFEVEFNLAGEVHRQMIAPLMFIPFIENSFKHGINSQIKQGFITINMNIEDEEIDLQVMNSKVQKLPSIHRKKSGGIGLINVQRRLDLYYPEKHELTITDAPDKYEVNLNVQL